MNVRKTVGFMVAIGVLISCLTPASIFAETGEDKTEPGGDKPILIIGKKPEPESESLWYSDKNPMKKEHQKLLWDYCQQRGLDYIDMLALISVESNFNEKCSTSGYKGYFQIGTGHGPNLSKALDTENKPLDGAININWGTAMYSWILADERVKDLTGKAKRDAALSVYQRGTGGYDKYGLNASYLKKYYAKWDIVRSWFGLPKQQ